MGYAVWQEGYGTCRFESEKIANMLYEMLDGKKELFEIAENGNMKSIKKVTE